MSKGISDQLDEMEGLGQVDRGEQYEWDTMQMFYDYKSRIFRWHSGAGCSCSWIDEDYDSMQSLDEMEFGRKDEAIRAVKRFIDGEDQSVKDQGHEMIQAIKSSRGQLEADFIAEGHRPTLAEGAL